MTRDGPRSWDGVRLLRLAIGSVGIVTIALAAIGLILAFRDPTLLRTNEVTAVVEKINLPVEVAMVVGLLVPMATSAVTGAFVFVRRPRDPLAMVFSLMLVTLSSFTTRSLTALLETTSDLAPVIHGITVIGFSAFFYFLLVFPYQRFASRGTAVLWLASSAFIASRPQALQSLVIRRVTSETSMIDRAYLAGVALILVVMVAAQVIRFVRAHGEERLQMKWVMLPMAAIGGYVTSAILVPSIFFELSPTWFGVATLGAIPISLAFPVCIARGVVKYRLYEIDLVINRALVYGALTAILATFYAGLVFAFQALLEPFTAESDLAIAGSTLAVAALFRPVRSRVQAFIDKRFYRRKFDAEQTAADFSSRLRDEVELGEVTSQLVDVVRDTMQPAHISLWLREGAAR